MIEFFYAFCAMIVLLILLFSIQLNLTKAGKVFVLIMSFLFCELGIYLTSLFHLIGTIAILIVLMLAITYLLQSKLNGIIFEQRSQLTKHFHEEMSDNRSFVGTKELLNNEAPSVSLNDQN